MPAVAETGQTFVYTLGVRPTLLTPPENPVAMLVPRFEGMEVDRANLPDRALVFSDFTVNYDHHRITGSYTDQFHLRRIKPPEILTDGRIPMFDIRKGSFAIATMMSESLSGTVGVTVVDPGVNSTPQSEFFRDPIALKTRTDKWLIIPNNNLATFLALTEGLEEAWKLDEQFFLQHHPNGSSCQGRDIFGPAAALISLSRANLPRIGVRMDPAEVKIDEIRVGDKCITDPFGQEKYAFYLPPGATAVDIQTEDGGINTVPVLQEGGFADMEPGVLHVIRGSNFPRRGFGGLAEAAVNQGSAHEALGNQDSKIINVHFGATRTRLNGNAA